MRNTLTFLLFLCFQAGDVAALSTSLAREESAKDRACVQIKTMEDQLEDMRLVQGKKEHLYHANLLSARTDFAETSRKDREEILQRHEVLLATQQKAHMDIQVRLETEKKEREMLQAEELAELNEHHSTALEKMKIMDERTKNELIQELDAARGGHEESLSLYRADIGRLEKELNTSVVCCTEFRVSNERIERDNLHASQRYEALSTTQNNLIEKKVQQMETLQRELNKEIQTRHATAGNTQALTDQIEECKQKEQNLIIELNSARTIATQVPDLLQEAALLKTMRVTVGQLKQEQKEWIQQRDELLSAGDTLKKAMQSVNAEKNLLDRTCQAQEEAASEWRWRCELAMRGVVPSLVQRCREMVSLKSVLWKELKKCWAARRSLDALVEMLLHLDGGSREGEDNNGPSPLIAELGLIDPIVVGLLRKERSNPRRTRSGSGSGGSGGSGGSDDINTSSGSAGSTSSNTASPTTTGTTLTSSNICRTLSCN